MNYLYAALGAVFVAVGIYFTGHHNGWTERDQEMQVEIAKKNEEARAKEQELNTKLNEQEAALRKAKDDVAKKQSAMQRLADAGQLRLPSSCVQASPSAPAPSGDRNQDAAELERQTITALIAIAADGDKAIVQLNQCIDTYQTVMEKINGQR